MQKQSSNRRLTLLEAQARLAEMEIVQAKATYARLLREGRMRELARVRKHYDLGKILNG